MCPWLVRAFQMHFDDNITAYPIKEPYYNTKTGLMRNSIATNR